MIEPIKILKKTIKSGVKHDLFLRKIELQSF